VSERLPKERGKVMVVVGSKLGRAELGNKVELHAMAIDAARRLVQVSFIFELHVIKISLPVMLPIYLTDDLGYRLEDLRRVAIASEITTSLTCVRPPLTDEREYMRFRILPKPTY
jgi:hypothetical protein